MGGLPYGNNYQTGLAISNDGLTWTKSLANPVIGNYRQGWCAFRVIPQSAIFEDNIFKLWFYGDGANLCGQGRYPALGYAYSSDAENWTLFSENPILSVFNGTIQIIEVIKFKGDYLAYYAKGYSDCSTDGNLYYATSNDGIEFIEKGIVETSGNSLLALTSHSYKQTDFIFSIWEYEGSYYYGISRDGVNFDIDSNSIAFEPQDQSMRITSILIEEGLIKFWGDVDVGNVIWNYGNEEIWYGTAIEPDWSSIFDVDFTWPVGPRGMSKGHYGSCKGDWGPDPYGCYWLNDEEENILAMWRDVQPFQRHNYKPYGWHLGADYNLGYGNMDQDEFVYPTSSGIISKVLENICGWGNIIFIKHNTSLGVYTSMYAHVDWLESGMPQENTEVSAAEPIAYVGDGSWNNLDCDRRKAGRYPYHLHFEIRKGDNIMPRSGYTLQKVLEGPQGQIDANAFISEH